MDIKVNRFSGYKMNKDPKINDVVDKFINLKYWDADGWSTIYYMSIENIKKEWKFMDDKFLNDYGDSTSHNLNKTKTSDKLKGVFDFIEKKDKKESPYTLESTIKTLEPNTIYPGKVGFGVLDKKGNIVLVPYPADIDDKTGDLGLFITDVKDGGIFTWNDNLEKKMKKDDNDFVI